MSRLAITRNYLLVTPDADRRVHACDRRDSFICSRYRRWPRTVVCSTSPRSLSGGRSPGCWGDWPRIGERLHEVGDGVFAGGLHASDLGLLALSELGLLPLEPHGSSPVLQGLTKSHLRGARADLRARRRCITAVGRCAVPALSASVEAIHNAKGWSDDHASHGGRLDLVHGGGVGGSGALFLYPALRR
jgi:hypothetical protein